MLVVIESVALPPKPETPDARLVQLFAYTREEAGEANRTDTVRDANHALQIVKRLVGGVIAEGAPPRENVVPLWTIQLQVSGTRRVHSCYRVAYRKHGGCPLPHIDLMMETYHAIKRVLRECREDYRRAKEAKA